MFKIWIFVSVRLQSPPLAHFPIIPIITTTTATATTATTTTITTYFTSLHITQVAWLSSQSSWNPSIQFCIQLIQLDTSSMQLELPNYGYLTQTRDLVSKLEPRPHHLGVVHSLGIVPGHSVLSSWVSQLKATAVALFSLVERDGCIPGLFTECDDDIQRSKSNLAIKIAPLLC